MFPRRHPALPVGAGQPEIPYDQSGVNMPGMQVPEPGGTMKKMSFEFTDPAQAAAQQQGPPAGAGVMPAGAQAPPQMPSGAQAPQEGAGGLWGQMAGGADQFGQGPDSSMFTDDQLAAMLQSDPSMADPIGMEADELNSSLMGEQVDPNLQMQMMMAARRMGGF